MRAFAETRKDCAEDTVLQFPSATSFLDYWEKINSHSHARRKVSS